ncbi:MAG: septum formation initiator family protein [Clostridia bacterium]|nr:septum formation initiator family protein [Clostridia bacterium]
MNRGREIRAELAAAEQDLEDIKAEEAAVDTDEYIERRAREDLGYVYDYETVYIRQ